MHRFVLILVAGLLPAVALAEEKPGIAALDLEAVGDISGDLTNLLNEAILSRLTTSGRFSSVLSSSDVLAMLSHERQKEVLGCDEDSCLSEIGGALGVPYLFRATLGEVAGQLMLNLKIIQVNQGKVAARMTRVFPDERELLAGLHMAIDELVASTFGRPVSTQDGITLLEPSRGGTFLVGLRMESGLLIRLDYRLLRSLAVGFGGGASFDRTTFFETYAELALLGDLAGGLYLGLGAIYRYWTWKSDSYDQVGHQSGVGPLVGYRWRSAGGVIVQGSVNLGFLNDVKSNAGGPAETTRGFGGLEIHIGVGKSF